MIAVRLLAHRAVIREAVFRDAPVLIGRGRESDFVILDPSVSRAHARLARDESGGWWLEDLSSRNGLEVGSQRQARIAVPAQGVLRCRLGGVDLEVAHDSTGDTLELRREELLPVRGPSRRLPAPLYWLAGVAAWIAIWAMQPSFWSPWKTDRSTEISWVAVAGCALLPVLAFLALGLLRIGGRRVRLADTMYVLALFSWSRLLIGAALIAAFYVLPPRALGTLTSVLGTANVVLFTAWMASLGRTQRRRRFFLAWTAALAVLAVGVAAAGRLAHRQSGSPDTDYLVMVPLAGLSGPASTPDAYFDGLRRDFGAASAEAAEELRRTTARGR